VDELSDADLDYIREAIKARARFLSKIPEKQRERDYLLGLPKQDRSVIEKHQDELLEWYGLTSDIFSGRLDSGLEYLAKLMDFIAQLSIVNDKTTLDDISPSDAQPALFDISEISGQEVVRQNIFKAWVRGDDRMEVARHLQAVALNINFDFYVEHILEVNLPWGMSAIGRFLSNLSQERGLPLLRNLEYLPSLIKYGVPSEMACHLVRRGFSRPAAKKISDLYVRIARSQDVLGVTFEPEDLLWTGDVVIQVLRGLSDSDTAALELKGEDHRTLSEIRRQNML
jgi:hypothetical protein